MISQDEFIASTSRGDLPRGLPSLLKALWYEARGEWRRAHEIVQAQKTADAAWVHAYLHRKEGDLNNAGYWYRRSKRQIPTAAFEDEWREIVNALIVSRGKD